MIDAGCLVLGRWAHQKFWKDWAMGWWSSHFSWESSGGSGVDVLNALKLHDVLDLRPGSSIRRLMWTSIGSMSLPSNDLFKLLLNLPVLASIMHSGPTSSKMISSGMSFNVDVSPTVHLSSLISLSLYLSLALSLSIYIYICAVESKLGPTIAFFESKLGPIFLSLCFSKIFFFLQGEWDVHKNRTKIRQTLPFLSQNLVQSCFATYLDQVLTQRWTKFWLNLFGNLGPFFLLQKMLKPLSL